VLRGDTGAIVISERASVQDNVVVHVNEQQDTIIGDDVLGSHGAVLEGRTIGDGALIGMRAVVLSAAVIGRQSLVAAGAVVRENSHIPDAVFPMQCCRQRPGTPQVTTPVGFVVRRAGDVT